MLRFLVLPEEKHVQCQLLTYVERCISNEHRVVKEHASCEEACHELHRKCVVLHSSALVHQSASVAESPTLALSLGRAQYYTIPSCKAC